MLRFILIFILVIYLLGILGRWLLLFWVKRMVKRAENFQQNTKNQKEGEITVDFKPGSSKKFDSSTGDYIDYEEVKD
jgi:hypothetical protein